MNDLLTRALSHPATDFIFSFGGLGLVLLLALNGLHKYFDLSERAWGALVLGLGCLGGVLLQATGLVALPGEYPWVAYLLGGFAGSVCAAAAAGFSAVDLRATFKPTLKE